jgi:hypothetical protein
MSCQSYFVTLSRVPSKALFTVLNLSFRYFTCDILVERSDTSIVSRVLFKEETILVHPIFKLSEISYSYAIFLASTDNCFISKTFRQIYSSFCIFLTCYPLCILGIFFIIQSTTSLLLLAHQISDAVSHC